MNCKQQQKKMSREKTSGDSWVPWDSVTLTNYMNQSFDDRSLFRSFFSIIQNDLTKTRINFLRFLKLEIDVFFRPKNHFSYWCHFQLLMNENTLWNGCWHETTLTANRWKKTLNQHLIQSPSINASKIAVWNILKFPMKRLNCKP